jgi:hypothetical protein
MPPDVLEVLNDGLLETVNLNELLRTLWKRMAEEP